MAVPNKSLIFRHVPTGLPVPGKDLTVESRPFDLSAPPPPGGLTLSVLYASYDPYQRGKMRDASAASYSAPYALGEPVSNAVVGRVLRSDAAGYREGDLVVALAATAEYAAVSAEALRQARRLENPHGLDLALFLGPLGMPGLTAWSSLYRIGRPARGETIFVSSAAGAVGQVVGQVAKREGLRVIGSVGSDAKLAFIVDELGFDGGFNYQKEKADDALKRLAPDGVDIYYDNVGGEQLDAALAALKVHGRIVACGSISGYNLKPEEKYGVKNTPLVVGKRAIWQGFIVTDPEFGPAYAKDHQTKLQEWLADGSIKAKLHVTDGIDNAAEGFVGMLQGKNFGKAVLKIRDD